MMTRRTSTRLLAIAAVTAVVTGACGSTRSDSAFRAAYQTGPLTAAPGATSATAPQDASSAGDGTAALTPAPAAMSGSAGSLQPSGGATAGGGTGPAAPSPSAASASAPGARPGSAGASAGRPGSVPASPSSAVGGSGGSKGVAPAPPTPGGAAAVPGAGTPIRLGSVSTLSGPAGAGLQAGVQGMQTWVQWINAHGGLAGHPVEYLVVDDRGEPTRAKAAAQDLVENRGVIAFAAEMAPFTHTAIAPYLESKHIPALMCEGDEICVKSPMYFPQGVMVGPDLPSDWIRGHLLVGSKYHKGKKLGILSCAEAQVCKAGRASTQKYAADFGYDLVWDQQSSIASPDFTAQCLSAKSAGVEVLLLMMEINTVKRLGPQCGRQGFTPEYITFEANPSVVGISEYVGMTAATQVFPYSYEGPETADFRAALAQYAPQVLKANWVAGGWVTGKMLERAIGNNRGPITSQTILDGLWTFKNETLGGLTVPLTFAKDQPATVPMCVFATQVGKTKIETPSGISPVCR